MQQEDLIIKHNGRIIKYKFFKEVKKNGNGGGITLPKELIGKKVYVEYIKGGK